MVANILPATPPPPHQTLVMGSIGKNSTFSEHGHVSYQIKGNHEMQKHGSRYFARRPRPLPPPPPPEPGDGVNGSKINSFRTMSWESGNHQYCNMVANILPTDPSPHDPGDGVNRSTFSFFRTWSCCIVN